jgi:hypothetical protein
MGKWPFPYGSCIDAPRGRVTDFNLCRPDTLISLMTFPQEDVGTNTGYCHEI